MEECSEGHLLGDFWGRILGDFSLRTAFWGTSGGLAAPLSLSWVTIRLGS